MKINQLKNNNDERKDCGPTLNLTSTPLSSHKQFYYLKHFVPFKFYTYTPPTHLVCVTNSLLRPNFTNTIT